MPAEARNFISSLTFVPVSDALNKVPISPKIRPPTPKSSGNPSGKFNSFLEIIYFSPPKASVVDTSLVPTPAFLNPLILSPLKINLSLIFT